VLVRMYGVLGIGRGRGRGRGRSYMLVIARRTRVLRMVGVYMFVCDDGIGMREVVRMGGEKRGMSSERYY
jgi:hypothetical protein